MIFIWGYLTKGERMDLKKIKQIKECWKKYDNGRISLGILFKKAEEECNATSQEIIDAIHYDLTGKVLGIVL